MLKFVQLLTVSIHNIHELYNLGKYFYFAFKSREGILTMSFSIKYQCLLFSYNYENIKNIPTAISVYYTVITIHVCVCDEMYVLSK